MTRLESVSGAGSLGRVQVDADRFLTPLRIEKLQPFRWLLIDDLVFRSARFRGTFVVPRGFQTDLASIPRWVWPVFPQSGDRYDAASVLHDAGYGHAVVTEQGTRVHLIKRYCDQLFLDGSLALGVGSRRAHVMHWFVSKFGDPLKHPLAAHVVALQKGFV